MKKKWCCIAALVLVCALVAVTPAINGAARADEIDGSYLLLPDLSVGEEFADLREADLVVDIFRVAIAEQEEQGALRFSPVAPYEGLIISDNISRDELEILSLQAAAIAFNAEAPDAAYVKDAPISSGVSDLAPGMYLVAVHEAGNDDYVMSVKDEDGNDILVTTVSTAVHEYEFSPTLVLLANDTNVTLKPRQTVRNGSLEIVKTIEGYLPGRPATFLFDVEAVLDGQKVFSDVVTISFAAEGQDRILIDDIPVGAEVTITEVYSGAVYRLVSDATQTAVIGTDTVASVEFVNEPTDYDRNGGSIVNRFTYGDNGWEWTPIPVSP